MAYSRTTDKRRPSPPRVSRSRVGFVLSTVCFYDRETHALATWSSWCHYGWQENVTVVRWEGARVLNFVKERDVPFDGKTGAVIACKFRCVTPGRQHLSLTIVNDMPNIKDAQRSVEGASPLRISCRLSDVTRSPETWYKDIRR